MKRIVGLIVLIVSLGVGCWLFNNSLAMLNASKPIAWSELTFAEKYPDPDERPIAGDADFPVQHRQENGQWVAFSDYWVINCSVSESTIKEVDGILERLNADNISQTAFFCLPRSQASNKVWYTTAFLNHYGLGLPDGSGPRANNGAAFGFFYDENGGIEVHYAAGFGQGALTAPYMTPLNHLAEDTYAKEGLDKALLKLATAFNEYARSKYQPWEPTQPEYGSPTESVSEEGGASTILLFIIVALWILVITEIPLSLLTIIGLGWAYTGMGWPRYLLHPKVLEVLLQILIAVLSGGKGTGTKGRSGNGGGGIRGN